MAFDYKKEYKEFYFPKNKPSIIEIPKMNFIAVRGKGDPNDNNGEYQQALSILYSLAFTLKMSYKGDYKINGYYPYVVPPLEGFWWMEDCTKIDYAHKEKFQWISIIRLPDFISEEDFIWAKKEVTSKKRIDCSNAEFLNYEEGLCVQCMHLGPYDNEIETIEQMENYAKEQGYEIDITNTRFHHEIYLSDPRRCAPERLRTIIRHPIKKSV